MNASIGTRSETRDVENVLGPFGIHKKNESGDIVIRMLVETKLKAMMSFFEHSRYDTWLSLDRKTVHQNDHWLVDTRLRSKVLDAKRNWKIATHGDHTPIVLKLRVGWETINLSRKIAAEAPTELDWNTLKGNEDTILEFQCEVDRKLEILKTFNAQLTSADLSEAI